MTLNQENTATIENEPMAQQKPTRVIDVDFSKSDATSAFEDMPKLGTKEFEELSRSLDTRSMGYRFIKRAFDIGMSICVLVVGVLLWPITLVMLIVIAVQTKGFPIYIQERIDSRIIETNARRPLSALVFASAFLPKNTVVSAMFPQVNALIMYSADMVGKFFVQTGRKTTQFSQKLAKRIFALSEGLNNRVRIPPGAAGFIQPVPA